MQSHSIQDKTGSDSATPAVVEAHVPWATLTIVAAALVLHNWPALQGLLLYDRTAVLQGEWWRLWTAHVVHFGASHLWWNLAIFVVAGVWLERIAPRRFRVLLALGPLMIGLVLLAGDAALARYAGLSGVGAGVVTLLALTQLRRTEGETMFWRAVLAVLALKIGLEVVADRPLFARFDQATVHSVPLAHLAGASFAVVIHFVRASRQPRRASVDV